MKQRKRILETRGSKEVGDRVMVISSSTGRLMLLTGWQGRGEREACKPGFSCSLTSALSMHHISQTQV